MSNPTVTEITLGELRTVADEYNGGGDPEYTEHILRLAAKAHARGDAVLVYKNVDLGSPDVGELKILSYGSAVSYIEQSQFPEPPQVLPDSPSEINWRFYLQHICRAAS